MIKFILTLATVFALTACGGGGDTYVANEAALPDTPLNGDAFIVQADQGSSVGISYTQLNDGSILVQCGDGDGYNCQVFTADIVTTDGSGAGASGGCSNGSNCP
jgi:uncharacterized membrane protein